jgi:hypothetical protein
MRMSADKCSVRIDTDPPDDDINEVSAEGFHVHLERMADETFSLILSHPRRTINFTLWSKTPIKAFLYEDSAVELP